MGCKDSVTSDRLRAVQFKSKQLSFVEFSSVPLAEVQPIEITMC